MNKILMAATAAMVMATTAMGADKDVFIGKSNITLKSDKMTPEALWAMGRIGASAASPDGKQVVYQVGYYSVEANKSRQVLQVVATSPNPSTGGASKTSPEGRLGGVVLTNDKDSESSPSWICDGQRIAFLSKGQLWSMKPDGTDRRAITTEKDGEIADYKFSPDGSQVILVKTIPFHNIIKENPSDLPKATGRVITDVMYRHWDHYVEEIPHPFVAKVRTSPSPSSGGDVKTSPEGRLGGVIPIGVFDMKDMLEGEPYECPMEPFGGVEQLAWSPDSKFVAYTCRKKTGLAYSLSTDSDIYLYDTETGKTVKNLCKDGGEAFAGYDQNPAFSPDGRYVAWQSMEHDGYESDRNRLCVCDITTGKKVFVTEKFDSNVDGFCWSKDNKTLYFIGVWHGCVNAYKTNLEGNVTQLTEDWADFVGIQPLNDGEKLLMTRQSLSNPNDLWILTPGKEKKAKGSKQVADNTIQKIGSHMVQLTFENSHIMNQLKFGAVQQRWVKTTDGKDMLVWVILPSGFDETKKYPTLLFCEGGPQSPVSQFWSYRWNFQIMAANGYVIIAPNRRGLPGFGSEWNEEISGDWTGQCMNDYLSAIDDAANNLPFVDKDRLGAVGASFGGFSVYYLAGHHDKRFKCFISHDGAFNLESMYTDTEENWFSNWEYKDPFWRKDLSEAARRTYDNSPHKFVDKWDTPILCIHGELDYRINANQGMGAFNAARMKGIEAELLLFPDENHWVLKPQNGILWQRTFFNWLDRWLK